MVRHVAWMCVVLAATSAAPPRAPGTGASPVNPRPFNNLGRGKIFDASDAFGGVGNVLSRSIHDLCLQEIRFVRGKYRQIRPLEARK